MTFNRKTLTNAALGLIAQGLSGKQVRFTRIAATDTQYPESLDLKTLTKIDNIRIEALVSETSIIDDATVNVHCALTNIGLKQRYDIYAYGLYAEVNGQELLYSIYTKTYPDYFMPENGVTNDSDSVLLNLQTRISASENVIFDPNPSALATVRQLEMLQAKIPKRDYGTFKLQAYDGKKMGGLLAVGGEITAQYAREGRVVALRFGTAYDSLKASALDVQGPVTFKGIPAQLLPAPPIGSALLPISTIGIPESVGTKFYALFDDPETMIILCENLSALRWSSLVGLPSVFLDFGFVYQIAGNDESPIAGSVPAGLEAQLSQMLDDYLKGTISSSKISTEYVQGDLQDVLGTALVQQKLTMGWDMDPLYEHNHNAEPPTGIPYPSVNKATEITLTSGRGNFLEYYTDENTSILLRAFEQLSPGEGGAWYYTASEPDRSGIVTEIPMAHLPFTLGRWDYLTNKTNVERFSSDPINIRIDGVWEFANEITIPDELAAMDWAVVKASVSSFGISDMAMPSDDTDESTFWAGPQDYSTFNVPFSEFLREDYASNVQTMISVKNGYAYMGGHFAEGIAGILDSTALTNYFQNTYFPNTAMLWCCYKKTTSTTEIVTPLTLTAHPGAAPDQRIFTYAAMPKIHINLDFGMSVAPPVAKIIGRDGNALSMGINGEVQLPGVAFTFSKRLWSGSLDTTNMSSITLLLVENSYEFTFFAIEFMIGSTPHTLIFARDYQGMNWRPLGWVRVSKGNIAIPIVQMFTQAPTTVTIAEFSLLSLPANTVGGAKIISITGLK